MWEIGEKADGPASRELELKSRFGMGLCAGKKVLIVDGDNFVCDLISRLLRNHLGLEASTAGSGTLAIAEVLTGNYDAAIISLILPQTSGLQAIRAIKEMRPDFPIIALTSDSGENRTEFMRTSGVERLFSKPVRIPVLLDEMIRILTADANSPVGK